MGNAQISFLDEIIVDSFAGGGNAVPPPFATALVRANLPEWCGGEIRTMAEFEKVVAV